MNVPSKISTKNNILVTDVGHQRNAKANALTIDNPEKKFQKDFTYLCMLCARNEMKQFTDVDGFKSCKKSDNGGGQASFN